MISFFAVVLACSVALCMPISEREKVYFETKEECMIHAELMVEDIANSREMQINIQSIVGPLAGYRYSCMETESNGISI
jgi:hypothetical protein